MPVSSAFPQDRPDRVARGSPQKAMEIRDMATSALNQAKLARSSARPAKVARVASEQRVNVAQATKAK